MLYGCGLALFSCPITVTIIAVLSYSLITVLGITGSSAGIGEAEERRMGTFLGSGLGRLS